MTAEGIPYSEGWSTGTRKHIEPGDRLFLLKQGKGPRGITGSGKAVSHVYPGPHWDDNLRLAGKTTLYVKVEFDRILDPEAEEILQLASLKEAGLGEVNWNTRASGISMDEVAERLERLWQSHLMKLDYADPNDEELTACEGELREALRRHRRREGRLRRSKITQVLEDTGRLACEVPGCGVDFFEIYGQIGREFAHVHHLLPLGNRDRPSLTRLSDLAIVCPNCHAMIHRGGKNRPLKGLIRGR